MLKTTFILTAKKQLTHDVFELVYSCPEMTKEIPKPGQYVIFQLAPGLNRSYSFSSFSENEFTLIIKRVPQWKWSPIICDAEVGSTFSGILPLGHFVLRETLVSKCFIGTGTGFAPLYAMVLAMKESGIYHDLSHVFLYGVKDEGDAFYQDEMQVLHDTDMLEFRQYYSEDDKTYATTGYVTSWITPENVKNFNEYYICGSPAMVKDAREMLEGVWVEKENIFFEQY